MQGVTFNIQGMACGGCATKIEHALSQQSGVLTVKVSLADANAKINFDGGQTSEDVLKSVIEKLDFEVQVAS